MVTSDIFQRTFQLKFGASIATCFAVDVDDKQYIVTACHALPAVESKVAIQIQHDGEWKDLECDLVGIAEGELDVAVLAAPFLISPTYPIDLLSKGI